MVGNLDPDFLRISASLRPMGAACRQGQYLLDGPLVHAGRSAQNGHGGQWGVGDQWLRHPRFSVKFMVQMSALVTSGGHGDDSRFLLLLRSGRFETSKASFRRPA
jgi:hypothetical protein